VDAGALAPAPLGITTASLPDGTVNEPYSATLQATGGTLPYTWAITGGLPAGLSLNASTGEIFGDPTAEGPQTFTVTVTDDSGTTDDLQLSIAIAPAAQGDVVIITKAVYNSKKGELTVEATSSASPGATLTITIDGEAEFDMVYNPNKDKYSAKVLLVSKPGRVTVTSSEGGSDMTEDIGGKQGIEF
jgi:hypothetical protein